MEVTKMDYRMPKYDEKNVDALIANLGFDVNTYFIAMAKPSMLSRALVGNLVDFSSRYCIVCFNDTEINLIMLSRVDSKHITEIVKINRIEISSIKLSNILISYMLTIKTSDSKMKFQVFKKVAKFNKIKNGIDEFMKIYCS